MNTVEFESDGRTYRVVQGLPGGNPYPTPRKGIFFLQKMSAGYDPAPHHYVRKVEELAAVREVLEVYADPGPFLRRKEHSEDPKLLFILGEVFSPCRMSSLEVPALAEMRPRYWSRGSLILPWDEPDGDARLRSPGRAGSGAERHGWRSDRHAGETPILDTRAP